MRVAILGTGKMGAAMARRLQAAGHELTLWNRHRSRAEAVGAGNVASTPAEAARSSEYVISMLTDASAVREVYLGEDGAVSAARSQVFVDMSTAGPDASKEIGAAIERTGALFVEAPVLGSIAAIESGGALVLAAGKSEALERAREILALFGEVRHIGDLGSAAALKLIANSTLADIYAITVELLAAGAAAGLKTEDVFAILTRFVPDLPRRRAGLVDHQYEPVTFAMRDMVKDLEQATALYKRVGAKTPITDQTKELYKRATQAAPDLEVSAIATLYEKDSAKSR
ncbi:MAG TPA: NAD(P)-dependent oxidoreductase [Candidatus Dormibacteraeota bacterium]|nr:NAD(P)-dependent oxidoreductase [Candidatus Dormibacteraeota bacterium]